MGTKKGNREIPMSLLGQTALDPYFGTTSAARGAMMNTHIGQAPIVEDNEPRRTFTGAELLYSQKTFDIRFPCDAQVLHVLRKYPTGMGGDSIKRNPITTIIYEEYYDVYKRVGVIHVPEFNSLHQDFGYKYEKNQDVWEQMGRQDAVFEKDTVLAASTAVKKDGQYGMGLNATVAFMSHPGTIEDGFVMSESFTERTKPRVYNTAIANSGRKAFMLNLYGDDHTYKPMPDIGDRIRDDGVIFALRDIDDDLTPADMTPRALRTIDRAFDRPVIGKPGARVVDITVYHDNRTNPQSTPMGMDRQLRKYYDANCAYYREILKIYNSLKRRGKQLRITPEFNQLIVEAMVYLPTPESDRKLTRVYRLETLDEWRAELTYETILKPAEAFKYTDLAGGKGVNCLTVPDDHMPVDQNGNRAEVIIYGSSTNRRSNFGRLYEHFTNAASRDLLCRLRAQCGFQTHTKPTLHQLMQLKSQPELIENIFATLMRYYQIVAPKQHALLVDDTDKYRHVAAVLKDGDFKKPGISLWTPPDNDVNLLDMTRTLVKGEFCPHYGPVTYKDTEGNTVTTANPILIADLYMIMLEKVGEDWSGVASVKTQHFGLPAKVTSADKSSTPGREQPVRTMGESETRSTICTVGPEATNELLDQTHNPASHCFAVENILTANRPTDIDVVVNRNKVPYGGSRSVALYQHLLECRGIRFRYLKDQPVIVKGK